MHPTVKAHLHHPVAPRLTKTTTAKFNTGGVSFYIPIQLVQATKKKEKKNVKVAAEEEAGGGGGEEEVLLPGYHGNTCSDLPALRPAARPSHRGPDGETVEGRGGKQGGETAKTKSEAPADAATSLGGLKRFLPRAAPCSTAIPNPPTGGRLGA